MFALLDAPIDVSELEKALAANAERFSGAAPLEQLRQLFAALKRSDVAVALLQWDRFDLRRLPALVLVDGAWAVVSRASVAEPETDSEGKGEGERSQVLIGQSGGGERSVPVEALNGSPVLWLRVRPPPKPGSGFLADIRSPAARLLTTELFRSRRWIVEVIVATVLINALAVASSLYSMQVYDRVIPTFSWATLWALSMGMMIVLALDWLLKYTRAHILDNVAATVDRAVSNKLFERLLQLRLDTRPRSVGTLAAQLNGLESVRAFFSSGIVFSLADLPFALVFIGVISIVGGPVAWVYLGLLPVALALAWIAKVRLAHLTRQELQRSYERHGMLVDAIQGAETIQANGSGWRFADAWAEITESISNYSVKNKHISSTTLTTVGSLSTLAYVLGAVVGVHAIEAGTLTMGGLIASSLLGGRVIAPIAQAAQIIVQMQHVREAINSTNSLLTLESQRREDQDLLSPGVLLGALDLEAVRFSYQSAPVVRLVVDKLTFKPGDRVALLGTVGCGKSTLLKVAAGLFAPSEGVVKYGDADLWELDPAQVGQEIGYLPQDVHLFRGTLRSNLMLAGHATDDRLIEVVKMLGIDQIAVDNSRGLDLEITEGGGGLSGGQRQMVCLGRLFIARPRVWLMDEPTASLDSDTENRVIAAIQSTVGPNDILVIATHRPKILSLCNRVIVMQKGAVTADGPPAEILAPLMSKGATHA